MGRTCHHGQGRIVQRGERESRSESEFGGYTASASSPMGSRCADSGITTRLRTLLQAEEMNAGWNPAAAPISGTGDMMAGRCVIRGLTHIQACFMSRAL
jgi:hypothetical protein